MRMGSLLYTQLSADPGEGTGGKKGNQKKMIKFYAFFPPMPPPYYFMSVSAA